MVSMWAYQTCMQESASSKAALSSALRSWPLTFCGSAVQSRKTANFILLAQPYVFRLRMALAIFTSVRPSGSGCSGVSQQYDTQSTASAGGLPMPAPYFERSSASTSSGL